MLLKMSMIWIWIAFIALVLVFLAIDLGIFHRTVHVVSFKEAGIWTSIWVSIALLFTGVIYLLFKHNLVTNFQALTPSTAAIKYFTGYLIELSLSLDNIFVIAVIFKSFNVPPKFQHRVLYWGIIGAIVFRGLMILFGVMLINRFEFMIYIFGLFLLWTSYKMWNTDPKKESDWNKSWLIKRVKTVVPVTYHFQGQKLFIKRRGLVIATPLFLALVAIETTDILFALDSIPAILAITSDSFIVFSSNILAILGLRSMYFFLANVLEKYRHIHYSLAVILGYVGIKLIISPYIHISEWISLSIIFISVAAGIILSRMSPEFKQESK